jgi:hypothetical protein
MGTVGANQHERLELVGEVLQAGKAIPGIAMLFAG